MKFINKYVEFINESQIDLILEAKMAYSKNFKTVLSKMNSPVAKAVLDLVDKEVDIDSNYLDINPNKDKEEYITFVPDSKVKPENLDKNVIITNTSYQYTYLYDIFKFLEIPDERLEIIPENTPAKIEREVTVDEVKANGYSNATEGIFLLKTSDDKLILCDRKAFEFTNMPDIKSTEVRIGKFVRRLLTKADISFLDKEYEEFVNEFKSQVKIENDIFKNFIVVKGEDIKKYYHEDNYEGGKGTINTSCMRYDSCQNYLDMYSLNTEQVSLVVLLNENGKVRGRAILWTDSLDRKIMDRIYYTIDSEVELFKKYAIQNEWYYKRDQDNSHNCYFMFNNEQLSGSDSEVTINLSVKGLYDYYPYMDTMKFYRMSYGRLTNNESSSYDYKLEDTDGGNGTCSTCYGEGRTDCYECDGGGSQDCGECEGSGNNSCDNCYGEGNFECSECEGNAEIDCSTCDGEGKDDEGEDCSDCDGSCKTECKDCKDGKIECDNCNGDGELECRDCDGNGTQDCYECDGNGRVRCGDC
jgi:hypothetical protein